MSPRRLTALQEHRDAAAWRRLGRTLRERPARRELAVPDPPTVDVPFFDAPAVDYGQAFPPFAEATSNGLATGLAIGLGAVAVLGLGVVVCYLLFRRRDDGVALPPQVVYQQLPPARAALGCCTPSPTRPRSSSPDEDPEAGQY